MAVAHKAFLLFIPFPPLPLRLHLTPPKPATKGIPAAERRFSSTIHRAITIFFPACRNCCWVQGVAWAHSEQGPCPRDLPSTPGRMTKDEFQTQSANMGSARLMLGRGKALLCQRVVFVEGDCSLGKCNTTSFSARLENHYTGCTGPFGNQRQHHY